MLVAYLNAAFSAFKRRASEPVVSQDPAAHPGYSVVARDIARNIGADPRAVQIVLTELYAQRPELFTTSGFIQDDKKLEVRSLIIGGMKIHADMEERQSRMDAPTLSHK